MMDNDMPVRGRVPKRKGGSPEAVSMTEPAAPTPPNVVKSGNRIPEGADSPMGASPEPRKIHPDKMTHEELLQEAAQDAHEQILNMVDLMVTAGLPVGSIHSRRIANGLIDGSNLKADSVRGPMLGPPPEREDEDEGFAGVDFRYGDSGSGKAGGNDLSPAARYPVRTATAGGLVLNLALLGGVNAAYVQIYDAAMPVWMFASVLAFLSIQASAVWLASNWVTANAVLQRDNSGG